MGTAAVPAAQSPVPAVEPPIWFLLGGAATVVYVLLHSLRPEFGGFVLQAGGAVLKLSLEGSAMLWAARRTALPARVRTSLQLLGGTALTSATLALILTVGFATGHRIIPYQGQLGWQLLSYALAVAALLVWPTAPRHRGALRTLVLDLLITVGGIGVLMWTLLVQPLAAAQPAALSAFRVAAYGLQTLGVMTGLTVVILCGRLVPSPRAFWWFVAGQGLYLPVTLLGQLDGAGLLDERWSSALYSLTAIPLTLAMVYVRRDPLQREGTRGRGAWASELNPLALVTPLAIGVFLLVTLQYGTAGQARQLAAALTAVASILALRLLLSSRENVRLLEDEARRVQQRHAEVTSAVGRLAGGIAHWFNNLLTTVIARAEAGETEQGGSGTSVEDFREIRKAGAQAAALTRQLLEYSTGASLEFRAVNFADRLRICAEVLEAQTGRSVTLAPGPACVVRADPRQLDELIVELVRNAVEATAEGGTVLVSLTREMRETPLESPYLSIGAGPCARLSVRDTGVGIATADLARVFDPFFTTKPIFRSAGLGLSAVHGIVAAHGGGITIDSAPGRGTEICVYLPLADTLARS